MAERVQILIDGGNLHHLVFKKLGVQELDFAFDKFAEFLANGRVVTDVGKRFYVGTVRERMGDRRSKHAMSRQTTLFTKLRSTGWEIKTSKLRTRREKVMIDDRVKNHQKLLEKGVTEIEFERTREKGIDVKLATDLIVGAVDNKYDTAIIVSSDGDVVPAIDWVRLRQNKKVEYIGFSICRLFWYTWGVINNIHTMAKRGTGLGKHIKSRSSHKTKKRLEAKRLMLEAKKKNRKQR